MFRPVHRMAAPGRSLPSPSTFCCESDLTLPEHTNCVPLIASVNTCFLYRPVVAVLHYLQDVIRLEARLPPNIGFTLRDSLAVFTPLAITPPKMNRFG